MHILSPGQSFCSGVFLWCNWFAGNLTNHIDNEFGISYNYTYNEQESADRNISTAKTCRAISSEFTIPAGICSGCTNTMPGVTFCRRSARKS